MKNYFALTVALGFYIGGFAQIEMPENKNAGVLDKIHWLIERSDMKTVRAEFQKICDENNFPSLVSGLKDGIYKGATPYDDYGYKHEVTFEMKNGRWFRLITTKYTVKALQNNTMQIIANECSKAAPHPPLHTQNMNRKCWQNRITTRLMP